jgi:predicted DNA binding protein
VEDGDCTVTIHLSPTADVRQLTEAVQDVFPDARMVTRRQVVHPADTPERVSHEIEEELTDRQQSALKAAYYAGFFEWPREATGEEIAESLGIAPPTLSQHLRKAEKKVFSSILSNGGGAERNGRSARSS